MSWNFVQREPVGVCAGIIPWNYPLIFAMWKIAPALAMGNSMVLKPAPQTPLSALAIARAIDETGLLPKGVLNVVTGDSVDAGIELVENPDVDKVAFTGSTATGRKILAAAAPTIKKVTLELGGKSANIVCPDADLDIAVDGALFGTFFHQGQMCESGTRLFVHDDIYDTFVDRLVDGAASLRVGDAADFDTQVGPVISQCAVRHDPVRRRAREAGRCDRRVRWRARAERRRSRLLHPADGAHRRLARTRTPAPRRSSDRCSRCSAGATSAR